MILVIGEILIDEFPDYSRIGGAAFNFAVHLHRFGIPVRFISRVGKDPNGEKILGFVSSSGLSVEDIQTDPDYPTGRVHVRLDVEGVPEFHILPDAAYDWLDFNGLTTLLREGTADMVYYGTLIQRTERASRAMSGLLSARPETCRAFCDINLRPGCYTADTLRTSVAGADILKLSIEEAEEIARLFGIPAASGTEELTGALGPGTVILTRGAAGSEWFSPGNHVRTSPPPAISIADTVGAGDAFAAAAAFGILRNREPADILEAASSFAAAVCGFKGAIPDDEAVYEKFLSAYG